MTMFCDNMSTKMCMYNTLCTAPPFQFNPSTMYSSLLIGINCIFILQCIHFQGCTERSATERCVPDILNIFQFNEILCYKFLFSTLNFIKIALKFSRNWLTPRYYIQFFILIALMLHNSEVNVQNSSYYYTQFGLGQTQV